MYTLFFLTGALLWGTLAAIVVLVVGFVLTRYTLATINVGSQLFWVYRTGTKRNDVTPWRIIVQDAHMMSSAALVKEIYRNIRWGIIRHKLPEKTGYMRLKPKNN